MTDIKHVRACVKFVGLNTFCRRCQWRKIFHGARKTFATIDDDARQYGAWIEGEVMR